MFAIFWEDSGTFLKIISQVFIHAPYSGKTVGFFCCFFLNNKNQNLKNSPQKFVKQKLSSLFIAKPPMNECKQAEQKSHKRIQTIFRMPLSTDGHSLVESFTSFFNQFFLQVLFTTK